MAVFIIVFTLAGGLFFGLRHWGKRMAAKNAARSLPENGGEGLAGKIEAQADNLEFAAEVAARAARRALTDEGAGDGGGGDGGS